MQVVDAVQFVFREFPSRKALSPAADEVFVRPNPAHHEDDTGPLGLALLVLEHGIDALVKGAGPAHTKVVVNVAPMSLTFDDMLAASFARRLLEGRPLPHGCGAFARYAQALRQGLLPLPSGAEPEQSIEALFQALLNARPGPNGRVDLSRKPAREQFRHDWGRMADCLFRAAEQGLNPFERSPFAGSTEFAPELERLKGDRKVYRRDVQDGERWWVSLPRAGRPPLRAAGLLLRRPDSRLFWHWARTDRRSPTGDGYLFLAVDRGDGRWWFTTDPRRHVPIGSLAEKLQAAESARDPDGAAQDRWYDGHRPEHNHTLVAAPWRGTKLSGDEVVRITRQWAGARKIRFSFLAALGLSGRRVVKGRARKAAWPPSPHGVAAWAALGILCLIGLALAMKQPPPPVVPPPNHSPVVIRDSSGNTVPAKDVKFDPHTEIKAKNPDITMGPGQPLSCEFGIDPLSPPYDKYHLAEMWVTVQPLDGLPLTAAELPELDVRVNDRKAVKAVPVPSAEAALQFHCPEVEFRPQTAPAQQAGHTVTIAAPAAAGGPAHRVSLAIRCRFKGTLSVLSIGIKNYDKLSSLPWAPVDAHTVCDLFGSPGNDIFEAVTRPRCLPGDGQGEGRVTKGDIDRELKALQERNETIGPLDLVIVALNGHGDRQGGIFYFCPSEYDPSDSDDTGLSATHLSERLSKVPCNVWLILNTCYSGQFSEGVIWPNPGALTGYGNPTTSHALVLFASALPEGLTVARKEWGGSPLTLALREAIENQYLGPRPEGATVPFSSPPGNNGLLTLYDLKTHIFNRAGKEGFEELGFLPMSVPEGDRVLQKIPIAPYRKAAH